MTGVGYDSARLALLQEVIRRKVDAGDTDDAIKESLLWEWSTLEQQQQIYGYLNALRLVAPRVEQTPTLRLDRYARAVVELREPDGTWPIQEAVAERLAITSRALRDKSFGGWAAILRRAAELAEEEAEVPE